MKLFYTSVETILKDLEDYRGSFATFPQKYQPFLQSELEDILSYIAFHKQRGNTKTCKELLIKYVENCLKDITHVEAQKIKDDGAFSIASEIYNFLERRSILNNEKISHEIFTCYFASVYLYKKIYEENENDYSVSFIDFKEKGKDYLNAQCIGGEAEFFSIEDSSVSETSADLLMKLDYEIHALNHRILNEKHPSYDTLSYTLTRTLSEKGFTDSAIEIIKALVNQTTGLYYRVFIKNYLPK